MTNINKSVVPTGVSSITLTPLQHIFFYNPTPTTFGYEFGICVNDTSSEQTVAVTPGWIVRTIVAPGRDYSYLRFKINNAPVLTITDSIVTSQGDLTFTKFYLSSEFDTTIFN